MINIKSRKKELNEYETKINNILSDNVINNKAINKLNSIKRGLIYKKAIAEDFKNRQYIDKNIKGIKYINKGINMLIKKNRRCKYE